MAVQGSCCESGSALSHVHISKQYYNSGECVRRRLLGRLNRPRHADSAASALSFENSTASRLWSLR